MTTHNALVDRDSNWDTFYEQYLQPFWQQYAQNLQYQTPDGLTLYYALIEHPQPSDLVILLPGRVETYLKYQEVIYDLYQAGFSVLTLDHRGQGMSSRMLSDPEKGYVNNFNDYAHDLQAVIEHSKVANKYKKVHCLAHSMGAAIALAWINQYTENSNFANANIPQLSSIVLSAPMLGINAGPLNQTAALWVAKISQKLSQIICKEPPFFIGQHGYFKQKFEHNVLCSSPARFKFAHTLQAQHKLGGVTTKWLEQALVIINQAKRIAPKIKCKLLLLQAQNELVVSKKSQDLWIKSALDSGVNCKKSQITLAKHEILMETDAIRTPVMREIIAFMQSQ
ncbi:alpha/beta fold hydrolase [Catenovulum adriaticum]|uniref:Alpha/beta fold hydrolase n=1 Tax=Catenovulum adriaticum TaxID=2984846 RepID=A0ABY7AMS2_9ALTE|nr:alpha/beta fold hydrolase [Catenovulum sp. TS8]WAJ70446.1 alpha/beta fold hydrolase [Catenovulum sp. TS8]